MRPALLLLALTACAHATPPSPTETTALAVDSIGLVVDVVAFVADHYQPPHSSATDGGTQP